MQHWKLSLTLQVCSNSQARLKLHRFVVDPRNTDEVNLKVTVMRNEESARRASARTRDRIDTLFRHQFASAEWALKLPSMSADFADLTLARAIAALENAVRDEEWLFVADRALCKALRRKGCCLLDCRGWLF